MSKNDFKKEYMDDPEKTRQVVYKAVLDYLNECFPDNNVFIRNGKSLELNIKEKLSWSLGRATISSFAMHLLFNKHHRFHGGEGFDKAVKLLFSDEIKGKDSFAMIQKALTMSNDGSYANLLFGHVVNNIFPLVDNSSKTNRARQCNELIKHQSNREEIVSLLFNCADLSPSLKAQPAKQATRSSSI